jgi:hypothetical protein
VRPRLVYPIYRSEQSNAQMYDALMAKFAKSRMARSAATPSKRTRSRSVAPRHAEPVASAATRAVAFAPRLVVLVSALFAGDRRQQGKSADLRPVVLVHSAATRAVVFVRRSVVPASTPSAPKFGLLASKRFFWKKENGSLMAKVTWDIVLRIGVRNHGKRCINITSFTWSWTILRGIPASTPELVRHG